MSYKKYIKTLMLSVLGAASLCLVACGAGEEISQGDTQVSENAEGDTNEYTSRDLDWSYEEVTEEITLSDETGSVTITKEGVYLISGSLSNGQVIVDCEDDDAKVQLVLSGVSINTENAAAIYVKNADKVFLTLEEGTDNVLSTSGAFVADGDINVDGVVFAKSDLTINGEGSLSITSTDNGIVSKDILRVVSGSLSISAQGHGLSGKDSLRVCGGVIEITCQEDALHGSGDESDATLGNVSITGGSFTIYAGDDGIHAESDLTIANASIDILSSYEGLEGFTVTINSGDIRIVASDDGINAAGGNDGSSDSWMAGGSSFNGNPFDGNDAYVITINGGELYICAGGDGIDSNGLLYLNGGTVYVDGPSDGANAAVDFGTTAYVNGGTLIAVGNSAMAENFSEDSEAAAILYTTSANQAAGTQITLLDSDGNELLTFTSAKSFNCVQLSCDALEVGQTYTLVVGEEEASIELTSNIYGSGNGFGGMHGGGMQGGGMPSGDMPDGEMPSGDMPGGDMPGGDMPGGPENRQDGTQP